MPEQWKRYKPFITRRDPPVDMRNRLQLLQQSPALLEKHMEMNLIFYSGYLRDGDWITFILTDTQLNQWQKRLSLTGRGFASAVWITNIDPITKTAKARLW